MNKQVIGLVLVAALMLSAMPAYAAESATPLEVQELTYKEPLDNEAIRLVTGGRLQSATGVSIDGRTFISLRAMSDIVATMIEWDVEKQQITIENADAPITMAIGDQHYYQNGSAYDLDVSPQMVKDTPMVPISIVAYVLNGDLQWDAASRTVYITAAAQASSNQKAPVEKQATTTTNPILNSEPTVQTTPQSEEPTSSQPEAPQQDKRAQGELAAWGYALKEGIYIENDIAEAGYGVNFGILELDPQDTSKPPVDQQMFKLTVINKYTDRIAYTRSFIYGELPKKMGTLVNLDVPLQYFNENEFKYIITVGGNLQ